VICRSCYRELPPGSSFCPQCGARTNAAAPEAPAAAPAAADESGRAPWDNPWEERAGRGPIAALAETLQRSLFHPVAFYRGTAPDRGAGAALIYAVTVGTLSIAVAFLWERALGAHVSGEFGARYFGHGGDSRIAAGLSLLLPVGLAVCTVAWAAVLHVCLAVLGGAKGGYGTTLKAVCYASSATAFNVFPVCGAALGFVWQVVLQVIGLRELHRTTTTRAFWAWLLPFLVAICLAGAVVFAMMFGLMKVLLEFGDGKFSV
jgi:hypothetical protein